MTALRARLQNCPSQLHDDAVDVEDPLELVLEVVPLGAEAIGRDQRHQRHAHNEQGDDKQDLGINPRRVLNVTLVPRLHFPAVQLVTLAVALDAAQARRAAAGLSIAALPESHVPRAEPFEQAESGSAGAQAFVAERLEVDLGALLVVVTGCRPQLGHRSAKKAIALLVVVAGSPSEDAGHPTGGQDANFCNQLLRNGSSREDATGVVPGMRRATSAHIEDAVGRSTASSSRDDVGVESPLGTRFRRDFEGVEEPDESGVRGTSRAEEAKESARRQGDFPQSAGETDHSPGRDFAVVVRE